MAQGENSINGYSRNLVIVVGVVAVVGMYVLFRSCGASECDVIVRQTTTSLSAEVGALESLAGIGLSEEKIEHLSTRSGEMATALRTCCVKTEGEGFLRCKQASEQYQRDLHQLVQDAKQAKDAQDRGDPQIAQRQLAKARAGLRELAIASDELVEKFTSISSFTGSWEKEANDQITEGNPVSLGTRTRGDFASADDRDYFKLVTPDGEPGKVRVILRKLAPGGMNASVKAYDKTERRIASSGSIDGKDPATMSFDGEPGTEYFLLLAPTNSESIGPYELELRRE